MSIWDNIKNQANNYLDDVKEKRELEKERVEAIKRGDLEPIEVSVGLERGEKAYLELNATRMATITEEITKKKGVLGRAVVGGVLLGPLGALGGAATAGSKTHQRDSIIPTEVDRGRFLMTDRRFLFIGSEIVSITFDKIINCQFTKSISGSSVAIQYPEMLKNETYLLKGKDAKIAEYYYRALVS